MRRVNPLKTCSVYYFQMSTRVCSACGTTVDRKDCHKNRYSEYICRRCQSDGIKFAKRGRRHRLLRWAVPLFFTTVITAGLLMLAIWMRLVTFDGFTFSDGDGGSFFGRHQGISLNALIKTKSADSAGQVVPDSISEKQ